LLFSRYSRIFAKLRMAWHDKCGAVWYDQVAGAQGFAGGVEPGEFWGV
jgi:hypothetical protein